MDNTQYQAENNVAPSDGEVGKLFRSAMRGFHKQDVTSYIERMARDRRRDAERYSAHIRSLEEERAAAAQELSHLRTQVAELTGEVYEARCAKEEGEAALLALREEQAQLLKEAEMLREEVQTQQKKLQEKDAAPAAFSEELAAVKDTLAGKDQEISRLKAELEALQAEKDQWNRENDAALRRSVTGGSAELINRVRNKPSVQIPTQNEVADYRRRIERARQSAQEGIVESNSLYQEMRRNIARLEEILRDLND